MTLALFAIAFLGHSILMLGSHNWFYGMRFPKWFGDIVHVVHAVLVLSLPGYLLFAGIPLSEVFRPSSLGTSLGPLTTYLYLCIAVTLVWLPGVTIYRHRRRQPRGVIQSEVVDVARQLGFRPAGDGHQSLLGRLPGTEIFHVEYVERTLHPVGLPPAWDGLTILHLTDLHFHGTPDRAYFRVLMDRCAVWMPDIVAITGDIADSPTHHRWIVPLLGRLRWRIAAFAILGNHDHRFDVPVIRRRLRRLGIQVPGNTWLQTEVRNEPLVVIGHEGPWLRPGPDLANCPPGFRLCLSHTPDNLPWACRHKVDLMLSGHVHGGQIRIPVFGSVLVPSQFGRRYDCGAFARAGTLLYVSRGISGDHPVRYNCMPEVTLLTLRRPQET